MTASSKATRWVRTSSISLRAQDLRLRVTLRRDRNLRKQVHENLRLLEVAVLDLVHMRMGDGEGPQPGSLAEAFGTLVDLQQEGLIRHVGISNVTTEQVDEAQGIAP